MKIPLGPSDAIFPVPASLVVCGSDGDWDIVTVAWIGIVSSTPPTIGISLHRSRYSLELIRQTEEFTVNIPSSTQYREVDYCGLTTGRKRNKFADTGLTPAESRIIAVPHILECPYSMECRLAQETVLGDWHLLLGEIVETHIDEQAMDTSTRSRIDISKVDPLVYCAEVREYWTIGRKLGDGFHAGKGLL